MWRSPRHTTFRLESGPALSELTLLQDLFIPEEMTAALVQLAQAIATFNSQIELARDWIAADPIMTLVVERKLEIGYQAVMGAPPDTVADMTPAQFNDIIGASKMDPNEILWAIHLFNILLAAHIILIGDSAGAGIHGKLFAVESIVAREGW